MAKAERSTACVCFPCPVPYLLVVLHGPEAPRAVCLATCVCTQIDHYALWVFSCLCPGSGTYGPGGCGRYWMLARHKITISFRKEKEPGYSRERDTDHGHFLPCRPVGLAADQDTKNVDRRQDTNMGY